MSTDKRTNAAVLRNRQRRMWDLRRRRQLRTRTRIAGTPERPRLAIHRSLGHIYAQLIDDMAGRTLVSASSLSKDLRTKCPKGGNIAAAKTVGTALAAAAKSRGVSAVVFDRRGYRYHGRVKAFAEAARAAGLSF